MTSVIVPPYIHEGLLCQKHIQNIYSTVHYWCTWQVVNKTSRHALIEFSSWHIAPCWPSCCSSRPIGPIRLLTAWRKRRPEQGFSFVRRLSLAYHQLSFRFLCGHLLIVCIYRPICFANTKPSVWLERPVFCTVSKKLTVFYLIDWLQRSSSKWPIMCRVGR